MSRSSSTRARRARRARGRRLARHAVAASAAALALAPSGSARADHFELNGGGGVFIGYHYGERSELEWGLEVFGTRVTGGIGCSTQERQGLGAFGQLSFLGFSNPRLTLGGHGGGELNRPALALTGELGLTYRFGEDAGFGLHTGVVAETIFLNAAARYQWLRNEAWVGGGLRVLGTYGVPSMCEVAIGRPLRSDAGRFAVQSIATDACSDNDGQRIEAVGRAFERDAQLEHASVPAFLQLAAELSQVDAPRALIARSLEAARDEVRHAALCMRLAERHLEACAAPALPPLVKRAPLAPQANLVRLAVESWLDGCVAEGRAAKHAARAAAGARDDEARGVLSVIARDEQRHAELGWAILQWAIARGGEEVREAVRALRELDGSDTGEGTAHEGLEAHGLLGRDALRRLAMEHFEASQKRLELVLG
jgi:hypothetical protein